MKNESKRDTTDRVSAICRQIRESILLGNRRPGERLGQDELSQEYGVSRIPVRQALGILQSEGLVSHRPGAGYAVVSTSADGLRQLYTMRRLLETELLEHIVWPNEAQLQRMEETAAEIVRSFERQDLMQVGLLNRKFHMAIFDLSPQKVLADEVRRIWCRTDMYSLFLSDETTHQRIVAEHEVILTALASRNRQALIEECDRHRLPALRRLEQISATNDSDFPDIRAEQALYDKAAPQ